MLQPVLMLVTSLSVAPLAKSLRPAFQPHIRHFPWYISVSASGAPKMSQIHVVQKPKITPVQHDGIVLVAFPFPLHFGNRNSMQHLQGGYFA